jgi:pyruvate,water dikinase
VLADFDALKARLLWQWKAPIVNDFEAMVFYGLLKRLTVAWVDPDGAMQNALLCGEGGIESTQVITGLQAMADRIARDPARRAAFLEASPEGAVRLVREDPAWSDVNAELERYLEAYGARCVQEMKLESVPMRENPAFCMALVRNYLSVVPLHEPQRAPRHPGGGRRRAASPSRVALHQWGPEARVLPLVLGNARCRRRNRRTSAWPGPDLRHRAQHVRSIGSRWAAQGLIESRATSSSRARRDPLVHRRHRLPTSRASSPSASRSIRATPRGPRRPHRDARRRYAGNAFRRASVARRADGPRGSRRLPGPGGGSGRVVFLPDADLRLSGEILIARETDPGWTVLFPSISGLVVEKGSMLSHSAIVAREMGIPAVVGVREATSRIKDGQRVRLDGALGKVYLLD